MRASNSVTNNDETMSGPKSLYEKLVDTHTVSLLDDLGHVLLYIDRQVLNEYTSPQAFSALRDASRPVMRPKTALAVVDHVNSTAPDRSDLDAAGTSPLQINYFGENCSKYGIELFDVLDSRQGIEHVVAPELGFILPGMVVAAGDSHTTTYGALGALGFGIGTSQIEHVLATQTLVYKKLKTMRVTINGALSIGVTAKDVVLTVIRKIGASGATGYAIEFQGPCVAQMSVEARMTMCNMAVEAGARGALIAPDQKVFDYLQEKPRAPKGDLWVQAIASWIELQSDEGAKFDTEVRLDADLVEPMVTWGTSPDQAGTIGDLVPYPEKEENPRKRASMERALEYMDLTPGTPLNEILISHAFIGSCTNGRIEDLRQVAQVVDGRQVAPNIRAIIVPGSSAVRRQAQEEGIAKILIDAGFEWRQSGCSMCLAMNDDVLGLGDRCASSTNRNFEGRQGAGARTHLMSPAMVAAAALTGRLADVRKIDEGI